MMRFLKFCFRCVEDVQQRGGMTYRDTRSERLMGRWETRDVGVRKAMARFVWIVGELLISSW